MPPAIVAVAAVAAVSFGYYALAVAIISAAYSMYTARKARKGGHVPQSQRKQMLRSATAPKNWIYGENISSGTLVFFEEQPGDQTKGELLHLVITHAGCPIDSIVEVFYNNEPISNYSKPGTIVHYPQGRTTPDPYLLSNTKNWRRDMIGQDISWMRVSLGFDADAFPTGAPTVSARKHGRRVLDPRNNQVAYSENPALCWYDYVKHHPSLQYKDDEILISTVIAAANICDERVNIHDASGNITGTEPRYRISAEFELNQDPGDVIEDILACMAGEFIRVGGMIGIHAGAYYGPTTLKLTEDDVIGTVTIQTEASRQDSYNVVRGVYNSKANNYTETDYPEVRFDTWIAEDGEEVAENIDLHFVSSPSQAQRIVDILARRSRYAATMEIPCNMRGLNYPPGSIVNISLSNIGFGPFEVKVLAWTINAEQGVTLVVRRELATFYDQKQGQDIVLPPALVAPAAGVAAPSSVRFVTTKVGEVVQGQLAWLNTNLRIRATDIVISELTGGNATVVQTISVPFPGTTVDLSGHLVGSYRAQLYAVAVTGARSAPAQFDFTIAPPLIPDTADITASNWNMQLVPSYNSGVIPVNTLFEFYHLQDSASFLSGQATFDENNRNSAKLVFTGSSLNQGGLLPDRFQHYWIRAVNAYGKSGFLYVQTGTTREQELVTTVLERLQAIDIVSANYKQGVSGFRLFPPNPQDPTQDGRAEFNDIIARGRIIATSGSIEDRLDVGNGYIDGRVAEDFINMNNGQFRVTHAGKLIANDAEIRGRIDADQIVGDLVSAKVLSINTRSVRPAEGWVTISRVTGHNSSKTAAAYLAMLPIDVSVELYMHPGTSFAGHGTTGYCRVKVNSSIVGTTRGTAYLSGQSSNANGGSSSGFVGSPSVMTTIAANAHFTIEIQIKVDGVYAPSIPSVRASSQTGLAFLFRQGRAFN